MTKIFEFKMSNGNTALIKTSLCKHYYVSVKSKHGITTQFVRIGWNVIKHMFRKIDRETIHHILINARKEL